MPESGSDNVSKHCFRPEITGCPAGADKLKDLLQGFSLQQRVSQLKGRVGGIPIRVESYTVSNLAGSIKTVDQKSKSGFSLELGIV